MNAYDSFLVVAAILGGLSAFFVLAALISDLLVPWLDRLYRVSCERPSARYRRTR